MKAATEIARLDRALAGYGQSVTLQRWATDPTTGANTVAEEVTIPAAVRQYGPQDIEAGEVTEIRVILSPTGLGAFSPPNLPRRDDLIVISGDATEIKQIAPVVHDGQLVRLNLLCRG